MTRIKRSVSLVICVLLVLSFSLSSFAVTNCSACGHSTKSLYYYDKTIGDVVEYRSYSYPYLEYHRITKQRVEVSVCTYCGRYTEVPTVSWFWEYQWVRP
ncbi:MAG: hypothetical protein N2645_10545 [Clostridia bacterium]|nr:hypothetical protein [Clostridia bacterium]